MNMTNTLFKVLALTALFGTFALATGAGVGATDAGFTGLEDSGESAKATATGLVTAFKWILALIPIWPATVYYGKMKDWLDDQDQTSQTKPKPVRILYLVGAVAGGIVGTYIVYGIFGMVFLNQGFNQTWIDIVATVWRSLFSLSA